MNTEWKRIRSTETHDEDCTEPEPYTIPMRLGDQLAHCRDCGARWVLLTQPIETTTAEPEPPRSTYACRAHHTPVNWRGNGCTTCQAERAERAQKRATIARKRRESARARLDQG